MADHCMVIPGKWTSVVCLWNFVIDTKKMQGLFWFVLGCLCLNDKTIAPLTMPSTILFVCLVKIIHIGRKT
ncbi:hypothetical protein Bca4012_072007 [Brassica carinata]|uniref:Uncharacterized protein n=1 Tax=Brassica carinata TaxID=52824 RepID=A0A8X7QHI0_BRACI|nr:hypothetical protein Bca52824_064443 [Brassica carinata]